MIEELFDEFSYILKSNIVVILITSLITAFITQLITHWFEIYRERKILNRKKQLILRDLERINIEFESAKKQYDDFAYKFEHKTYRGETYAALENLHSDCFNAIPKHELFVLFGKDMYILSSIYKTVDFLNTYGTTSVLMAYSNSRKEHVHSLIPEERIKHSSSNCGCAAFKEIHDIATQQFKSNSKSVDDAIGLIREFQSKY